MPWIKGRVRVVRLGDMDWVSSGSVWGWGAALGLGLGSAGWVDRERRRSRARLRLPPGLSFARQARELGFSEHGTEVFGSILMEGTSLIDGPTASGVENIYDNFLQGLKASNNGPCLGVRKGDAYEWTSYQQVPTPFVPFSRLQGCAVQVLKEANLIGMALRAVGLGTGSYVGIYARNCPAWVECQLGSASQGLVVVPLYDTLGSEAVGFILHQAAISAVFTDDAAKAKRLIEHREDVKIDLYPC